MGVGIAILAGISLNLGYLFQKIAVDSIDKKDFKMTKLLTKPLWLGGIFLQLIIGIGLFALAQLYIGPSLVPGLMALGVVFLVIGSNITLKEKFSLSKKIGVALIVFAIFFIGISELNINVTGFNMLDSSFLIRLVTFNIVYLVFAVAFLSIPFFIPRRKGLARIFASGLFFSLANLWISIVMGLWGQQETAVFASPIIWYFLTALGLTIVTGVLAVFLTQEAMEVGNVGVLIPVQNVPIQITPALLYFYVFNLTADSILSILYLILGILLIITGSFLLARHQPKPAGA